MFSGISWITGQWAQISSINVQTAFILSCSTYGIDCKTDFFLQIGKSANLQGFFSLSSQSRFLVPLQTFHSKPIMQKCGLC